MRFSNSTRLIQGIDRYVRPSTRLFSLGLIALVTAFNCNFAMGQCIRRMSPMTQLAQAESHITAIEKVLSITKAHTTEARGRHPMTKFGRSISISCVFLGALTLAPNSRAQQRPPILEP